MARDRANQEMKLRLGSVNTVSPFFSLDFNQINLEWAPSNCHDKDTYHIKVLYCPVIELDNIEGEVISLQSFAYRCFGSTVEESTPNLV